MKSNFEEILERIFKELRIKQLKELAEILGKKPNFLSRKKQENLFNAEWAFEIGEKYNLSTDWILTGKGEKRRGSGTEDPYAVKLAEWMEIKNGEDDRAKGHIEITIEEALPEFKKWSKERI
jgi:hypothetical protein